MGRRLTWLDTSNRRLTGVRCVKRRLFKENWLHRFSVENLLQCVARHASWPLLLFMLLLVVLAVLLLFLLLTLLVRRRLRIPGILVVLWCACFVCFVLAYGLPCKSLTQECACRRCNYGGRKVAPVRTACANSQ